MNNDFDFDPNDIARTVMQSEMDARTAEIWARARVEIAKQSAMAAWFVAFFCSLVSVTSVCILLQNANQQPIVNVTTKQPN